MFIIKPKFKISFIKQLILGIISHSAFMWINALYSCFLVVARHFSGKTTVYHLYIAIGIAAFTFFEFGFSVKELIQVRIEKIS